MEGGERDRNPPRNGVKGEGVQGEKLQTRGTFVLEIARKKYGFDGKYLLFHSKHFFPGEGERGELLCK